MCCVAVRLSGSFALPKREVAAEPWGCRRWHAGAPVVRLPAVPVTGWCHVGVWWFWGGGSGGSAPRARRPPKGAIFRGAWPDGVRRGFGSAGASPSQGAPSQGGARSRGDPDFQTRVPGCARRTECESQNRKTQKGRNAKRRNRIRVTEDRGPECRGSEHPESESQRKDSGTKTTPTTNEIRRSS